MDETLKSALIKKNPNYWKQYDEAADEQADYNSQNALGSALMKSAAMIGSTGGKMASAAPVEENAQMLYQIGKDRLGTMGVRAQRSQADEEMRQKMYSDLMSKEDARTQGAQNSADALANKKEEAEKGRELKLQIAQMGKSNAAAKPLKWDIVQGQTGENGEPILYNKDTGEFKVGETPAGSKMVGKEKGAGSPQYLAAGFGRRVEQAEQEMDQLEGEKYNRASASNAIGAKLPNIMQSAETQRQSQAERNFINSVLRRESGAAIAPSEFESAEKQYFPRAGDAPIVLAQKKRNRAQVLHNLKGEASNAWDRIPLIDRASSEVAKDGPAGKTVVKEFHSPSTGKTKIVYSDGTEEIK